MTQTLILYSFNKALDVHFVFSSSKFSLGETIKSYAFTFKFVFSQDNLALSENVLSTNIIACPVTHKFNSPCLSMSSYAAFHTGKMHTLAEESPQPASLCGVFCC